MARTRSKRSRNSASAAPNDIDDAKRLRECKSRPPLFTKDEIIDLETAIRKDQFGIWRRTALMILSESGGSLVDAIRKDQQSAVEFARAYDGISKYSSALYDLVDWIDAVTDRLTVALAARPDRRAIFELASRADAKAPPRCFISASRQRSRLDV